MKDYTNYIALSKGEKKELKKNFILKYEIVIKKNENSKTQLSSNIPCNKLIVIYFANKHKQVVEYSLETEKGILLKMKQQLENYSSKINKGFMNKEEIIEFLNSLVMGTSIGYITGLLYSLISQKPCNNFIYMTLSLLIYRTIIGNLYKSAKKDFEKNNLFLENEDLISKLLSSQYAESILLNVNKKVANACKSEFGINEMTLNSINNIDLKDMKEFLEIIRLHLVIVNYYDDLENEEKDKIIKKY